MKNNYLIYLFNPNNNKNYFELNIFTKDAEFIAEASFYNKENKIIIDGVLSRKGYGDLLYNYLSMYASIKNSLLCNAFGGLQESAYKQYERMFSDKTFKKCYINKNEAIKIAVDPNDNFINFLYNDEEIQPIVYGYSLTPSKEFIKQIKKSKSNENYLIHKKMKEDLSKKFSEFDSLFLYCMDNGTSIIDELSPLKKQNEIILFHGTSKIIEEFNEKSIGIGDDPNSALGVHSSTSPYYAAEYADMMSTITGDDGIIYVLKTKYSNYESIEIYDKFYGSECDDTNNHEHFKELRKDYLDNNVDLIFYDLEDNISTILNPNNIEIIDKLTIKQAKKLEKKINKSKLSWNSNVNDIIDKIKNTKKNKIKLR